VESPIGLKLYFKNLYKTKIEGKSNVPIFIVEPGSDQISNLNGQFKETSPDNNKTNL